MYEEMITKQELIDAQVDAKDLEKIINDAPETQVQTRLGRYVWTLSTIEQRSLARINEWQNAINTIVVNDGVPALAVSNANGKTQQEINDFGGAEWWNKPGGYKLGATVKLANGDIVKSTIANNIANPNLDMTGWIYANDAEIAKHSVYVPNGGGSIGAIGGTFRGYSGGVQFISDTAHAPFGTTGISKSDTYTVRIDHNGAFSKVGALNLTADESFAAMGVMSGASVAQNYSLAKVFAPLYFTCKGDGTITKVSPLFEGSVTLNGASNPSNGLLRFDHPLKSVVAHQAIACNRGFIDNISKPMEINVFNNDGGTYTQINAYTEQVDSVWIKYNETTAKFEAAQGINKALYSFVFNASTGLLSITHNTVKTGAYLTQPDIIPFQTANRYSINGVNATTTSILCYDPAGNIVKTLSTADFSFFFKIKPASREMILTAIPATNEFEVFVGNCFVPVDNLQKVPSGNIWFYGAMNK